MRTGITLGVFVLLQAAAAFIVAFAGVHGSSDLVMAAPIYWVVAVALTWWVAYRTARVLAVAGIGITMLAAAPGIIAAFDRIDSFRYQRRIAATRVSDVRDEPITSATGRPIGVRLTYRVSVPSRGYFGIVPSLYSAEPRYERLRLGAAHWTIDGKSEPTPFEPGKVHLMVVELFPHILGFTRDARCLQTPLITSVPDSSTPAPLRVVISESTYGNTYHGGHDELTRGQYDLAELYRGVLGEGLKPCA